MAVAADGEDKEQDDDEEGRLTPDDALLKTWLALFVIGKQD
jgi:hypothetical protein